MLVGNDSRRLCERFFPSNVPQGVFSRLPTCWAQLQARVGPSSAFSTWLGLLSAVTNFLRVKTAYIPTLDNLAPTQAGFAYKRPATSRNVHAVRSLYSPAII